MERNQLILLIISIIIAIFVGGTMVLILFYGEKQRNRLAEIGDIDEELRKEYIDDCNYKAGRFAIRIVELVLAAGFMTIFVMALIAKTNGNNSISINGQSVYVVRSSSMSKLNPQNPYYDLISSNKWNSRFDVYDMVFVRAKPEEKDLQLGQTIVYRRNGQNIIHRLVEIKPPSTLTKGQKSYICTGDANAFADNYILYEDIVGVYTSNKIPFVGVFVLWLQSSLGYVVVGIIVAYAIYSTYLERDLKKVRNRRLLEIGYLVISNDKLYLNPDFVSHDHKLRNADGNLDNQKKKIEIKEAYVKLSRRDIVNTRKVNKYNFNKTSKSKYLASDFKYSTIKCLNYKYICVRVDFKCENKNIVKYMFLPNVHDKDYTKLANKCIRYYLHRGKLNSYIKKTIKNISKR